MAHVVLFITSGMFLSYCIFISCPESPKCISSLSFTPVWAGSSLIYFLSFFRCRKLALIKENFIHV